MDDWKRYLILMIVLILAVLIAPSIITLIGIAVSPVISMAAFTAVLFIVTVIIAYKNKIGRK